MQCIACCIVQQIVLPLCWHAQPIEVHCPMQFKPKLQCRCNCDVCKCDLQCNDIATQLHCNINKISDTMPTKTAMQLQLWLCAHAIYNVMNRQHNCNTMSTILLMQCPILWETYCNMLCLCSLSHDWRHVCFICSRAVRLVARMWKMGSEMKSPLVASLQFPL